MVKFTNEIAKRCARWILLETSPAPLPMLHPVRDDMAAAADEIDRLASEEGERKAFIEAHHKNLDLTEASDAWGRPIFKHTHIEAMWSGWKERAALASSAAPIDLSAILNEIGEALECRGYVHMTNGRDIGRLLDELERLRGEPQEAPVDSKPMTFEERTAMESATRALDAEVKSILRERSSAASEFDALRWRQLPAHLEEFQIDYVGLKRAIDADLADPQIVAALRDADDYEKRIREKVFNSGILTNGEWVYLVGLFQTAREHDERTTGPQAAWQPIETAPQDGSEILILTSLGATQARFAPGEWHDCQEGREYDGPVWVCCDDQWQVEVEDCGEDGMHHSIATHWKPLDPSPVTHPKEK